MGPGQGGEDGIHLLSTKIRNSEKSIKTSAARLGSPREAHNIVDPESGSIPTRATGLTPRGHGGRFSGCGVTVT